LPFPEVRLCPEQVGLRNPVQVPVSTATVGGGICGIFYKKLVVWPSVPGTYGVGTQNASQVIIQLKIFAVIGIIGCFQSRVVVYQILHIYPVTRSVPKVSI